MMSGEVGFDDLAYKERELIQASMDPNRQINATQFTLPGAVPIPNLIDADINSTRVQPLFPGTQKVLLVLFIFLIAILVNNLLVGLAVNDVQVKKGLRDIFELSIYFFSSNFEMEIFYYRYFIACFFLDRLKKMMQDICRMISKLVLFTRWILDCDTATGS